MGDRQVTAIEQLAEQTLKNVQGEPNKGEPKGDVILTVTIIAAVIKLLILAYDCWKASPGSSLKKCQNPNWLQRFRMRRVVRTVLNVEGVSEKMEEACAALLKTGKSITQDQLMAAVIESQNDRTLPDLAAKYGV
jgi:hypothetical protein